MMTDDEFEQVAQQAENEYQFDKTQSLLLDVQGRLRHSRDILTELIEHVSWHHLSNDSHDHDCYQEWTLLRDEAQQLLNQEDDR